MSTMSTKTRPLVGTWGEIVHAPAEALLARAGKPRGEYDSGEYTTALRIVDEALAPKWYEVDRERRAVVIFTPHQLPRRPVRLHVADVVAEPLQAHQVVHRLEDVAGDGDLGGHPKQGRCSAGAR